MKKYLLVIVLVASISFFINYSETPKEQITVTIENNGAANVIHKITVDPFFSNIMVQPITEKISRILATDEADIFLKTHQIENKLRIDTLGASQVTLVYDAELVTKNEKLWKLNYASSAESTVILPPSSQIISLNKIPTDIANDAYAMPAGNITISFTIEPLKTHDFKIIQDDIINHVIMVTTADVENFGYDKNIQFNVNDNVALLAVIPKSLLNVPKQVLFENENIDFDPFSQNSTHYWLRMEAPKSGTFVLVAPKAKPVCGPGTQDKDGVCIPIEKPKEKQETGGCLIATVAFDSELSDQVQLLREIRSEILGTNSGNTFLNGFNSVYYVFSPTISDFERQNPIFKEFVKITITPMLSTLSILNYVEIDSESEMLGYGIGIILLNLGMYFVAPAFVVLKLARKFN
jgi:hypothetical protein